MAVAGLVDLAEARRLYQAKRRDFYLLVLCFTSTLFLGIQFGILMSVVASLVVVLRQTTRPHTAALGRVPGTIGFRNIERSPEAVTTNGVVLRVDAPHYCATSSPSRRNCAGWRPARRVGCGCWCSTPPA
jgi:MFS superfamily sulfate permease-like transporter